MDFDYFIGYLLGIGTLLFTAIPLGRGLEYEANIIGPNLILDAGAALEAFKRGNYTSEQLSAELSAAGLNATRQAVLILLQETLMPGGDAVTALYRGNLSGADFKTRMSKLGFSAATQEAMIKNFEVRLAAADLFDAEHRSIQMPASVASAEQELYAGGMTAERVALLRQLSLRVPQLADLFTFASWGAEDPAAVAAGGLDQDKPDDYYARALAAGYDKSTADLYWSSHWTPPPVFILHTLFQTGQLSEDDLAYFLKVAQHPPGFIPKIIKAFYKQISESQIVNLLQNNIIAESDVDGLLKNNGYSPDAIPLIHQDIMVKAALPSSEEKAALAQQKAQFKSLTVGSVMSAYEDGIITVDEVTKYLTDLQIAPDIITFQIELADFKVKKASMSENITAIGDEFMLGIIDQPTALSQLSQLGVSPVKQENLLVKWQKLVPTKVKQPSKADLDLFLKNGLIDLVSYQSRMAALGYAAGDVLLYIALINKSSLAAAELAAAQAQAIEPIP